MVIKKHLAHDDKQNKNKKSFHKLKKKLKKKVDDLTHPSHLQTKTYTTIHIIVVALLELQAVEFDKIVKIVSIL